METKSQQSIVEKTKLWTKNQKLCQWITQQFELCNPDEIHFCDGSLEESKMIMDKMLKNGTAEPIKDRPNSFLCRSDVNDVARVESRTFICSQNKEDAGPTNNWYEPNSMKSKLKTLFKDCMHGRTMFVIPFCMGPLWSKMSKIGVEITDSPYVVYNMRMMTRMGNDALKMLEERDSFVPCMHSVGMPLKNGIKDVSWPSNSEEKYIVHFPETKEIWSFGSGYGGNALLGKKCFSLRIASKIAKEENWLAEHMAIIKVTNPKGEKKYIAAAFPSACGKTNFAMMKTSTKGWSVECIGDDIAWIKLNDGYMHAINPENGFFGVAPGTSYETNPHAMDTINENVLFTNVAITNDGKAWWEGLSKEPPNCTIRDWKNNLWDKTSTAAHPNSRFTVEASQCPVIANEWEDVEGVPISAIIFGGRRSRTIPLISQSFNWQHGVFMGASISSEKTAAAEGSVGNLRHDPFAMLPFCGYNMGDYFAHWLSFGKSCDERKLPKIFQANWFLKDDSGFLWPGFGENINIIKWIFDRCNGENCAQKTPIGYIPTPEYSNILQTINNSQKTFNKLFSIDKSLWQQELLGLKEYFQKFSRLPEEIVDELNSLSTRINSM